MAHRPHGRTEAHGRYAPSVYSTRMDSPLSRTDSDLHSPPIIIAPPPRHSDGPFSRGRANRRRPTVQSYAYGKESAPRPGAHQPANHYASGGGYQPYTSSTEGASHAYGYTTAHHATGTDPIIYVVPSRSPSPSRRSHSRSPPPQHEPTLTPWARYVDDKYTDEWTRLASALHEYDEAYVGDCKEDIDTLLVFAGLFSAVLTAFNIESYKTLQQDSGDTSAAALTQISKQLSSLTLSSGTISSSTTPYTAVDFHPSASAVRINALWFLALILSLISASLGMLVKQWLREYLMGRYTSPQERIRIRYYKWEGLHQWRVFEIASILPALLQAALIMFFIGLSDFLRQLDSLVGWLTTGLIVLWLILFSVGTLTPAVSYRCPYKVPFLKNITRWTRIFLSVLLRRSTGRTLPPYSLFPGDERGIRRDSNLDIPAMLGADKLSGDDDFLEKTLRPCVEGFDGLNAVAFVRGILSHRLDKTIRSLTDIRSNDFDHLTTKVLYTSMYIIIDALEAELNVENVGLSSWMHEAMEYLFHALHYSYLRDRPIGSAMDSGLWLQQRLLVLQENIVQETLLLLAKYPYVRCVFRPIDSTAAERLLSISLKTLLNDIVEPAQLLRILLSIALLQFDLSVFSVTSRESFFHYVLRNISRSFAQNANGGYPIETLSFCLDLCKKLNARMAGFVPADVMRTLKNLARPSPKSENLTFTVVPPGSLFPGWSTSQHLDGSYGQLAPAIAIPFPPPRLASTQT